MFELFVELKNCNFLPSLLFDEGCGVVADTVVGAKLS